MRILFLAAIAPLAGCTANPPRLPPATEPAPPAAPGTRCDANAAQSLLGKPAGPSVAEALRLSGARTVRRYRSGDMLTMDLRPDRLNVETDAGGTIVRLSCG